MNEEIVVIIDANQSMREEIHNDEYAQMNDFLGTTKFDVARYMLQELMLASHTRFLALVTLGEEQSSKRKRLEGDKGGIMEMASSGGCCCYVSNEIDHKASNEWFQKILESIRPSRQSKQNNDFITGIVMATDTMRKKNTAGASKRRLVLVTDARHKVLESNDANHDPMEDLVDAVNRLRRIGCTLDVVGICFKQIANQEATWNTGAEQESEDESDGASSESEDDWSDIQEENELLIMDLVEKVGGGVQSVNGGDYCCVGRVLEGLGLFFEGSPTENEIPSEIGVKKETKGEDGVGKRDASSLCPDPETQRIHWNGSDDVLLPEWIKTTKPSCWSGDSSVDSASKCSWIQIDDPLQSEEGVTLSSYQNGKEENYCSGHWLVDCTLENVDVLWEQIAVATAYGKLGPTAKVSPTKHLLQRKREYQTAVTIHVRVNDFTDRAGIKRIFEVLNKDLNIHSSALAFETDAFVQDEVCENNRGQHSNCLYTVEEVFSS